MGSGTKGTVGQRTGLKRRLFVCLKCRRRPPAFLVILSQLSYGCIPSSSPSCFYLFIQKYLGMIVMKAQSCFKNHTRFLAGLWVLTQPRDQAEPRGGSCQETRRGQRQMSRRLSRAARPQHGTPGPPAAYLATPRDAGTPLNVSKWSYFLKVL